MRKVGALLILVISLLMNSTGFADTYDIDVSHSQVGFRIRHIVSKVRGHFDEFSGVIEFDEKKPDKLKADVSIKTSSINTNHDKRDEHLRSKDFFDVKKFPTMTFKSTKARKKKNGNIELIGDLTLLGVTKTVSLEVEVGGVGKDPWGNVRSGFSAVGKLNRKDFGMVYNTAIDQGGFVLGDEVEILLEIEGIKKKG